MTIDEALFYSRYERAARETDATRRLARRVARAFTVTWSDWHASVQCCWWEQCAQPGRVEFQLEGYTNGFPLRSHGFMPLLFCRHHARQREGVALMYLSLHPDHAAELASYDDPLPHTREERARRLGCYPLALAESDTLLWTHMSRLVITHRDASPPGPMAEGDIWV